MFKKMNKGKLELTSEMWIFFTFRQGLAPSWLHIGNFMSTYRQRFQSHASVFRRKTESTNYMF